MIVAAISYIMIYLLWYEKIKHQYLFVKIIKIIIRTSKI